MTILAVSADPVLLRRFGSISRDWLTIRSRNSEKMDRCGSSFTPPGVRTSRLGALLSLSDGVFVFSGDTGDVVSDTGAERTGCVWDFHSMLGCNAGTCSAAAATPASDASTGFTGMSELGGGEALLRSNWRTSFLGGLVPMS